MKKSLMGRVIGVVSLFMVLFLVMQSAMQSYLSRRHFFQSADISINQINEILERDEEDEISLRDSLKNDSIIIYFVADHATGEIVECTQSGYLGRNLTELGIDRTSFSDRRASHFQAHLDKTAYLAAFQVCGAYEIGVCQAEKDVYSGVYLSSLIVFVYLLFASTAVVIVVNILARKEREKEAEHQEQMKKALAQANAANEAKSVFLANMSHDIRTPMNAIIGFTELLEKHAEDVERRDDYIRKIKASGKYLLELLSNILEMARIESGQTVVNEKVCRLEQFDSTLTSIFREEVVRKNLKFHKEIQVEHAYIWCDPARVQEIFVNLISNAVKYTPDGGSITLRLEELPSDREGYAVYKTVIKDTGIGISKEFLPFIFDEFTRERNTTQCKISGTGLGMPIAKKLVDVMGGSLTVESEVGQGTQLTVMLPCRLADEESAEGPHGTQTGAAAGDFTGKRLLLAEDNDLNAEIATELLEEVGFTVERARDGVICVDMFQKADPGYYDLILMDIQMPNMNGYQATEWIRVLPGKQGEIPIIAMTANTFEEDKQRAFAAGMDGHVAKPIDVEKLMGKLSEFLTSS